VKTTLFTDDRAHAESLWKEITYTDGGKDVHLPLMNCTALLQKKKGENFIIRGMFLLYSLLILS